MKVGSQSILLDEHNYLTEVICIRTSLFTACFAQERIAGAAESVQAEQRPYSTAGRPDPAAPGPQYGHAESTEESGRCSHC